MTKEQVGQRLVKSIHIYDIAHTPRHITQTSISEMFPVDSLKMLFDPRVYWLIQEVILVKTLFWTWVSQYMYLLKKYHTLQHITLYFISYTYWRYCLIIMYTNWFKRSFWTRLISDFDEGPGQTEVSTKNTHRTTHHTYFYF